RRCDAHRPLGGSAADGDPADGGRREARLHGGGDYPGHVAHRCRPGNRGDLTLVTRPGIVVDTDDLSGRLGEVKVRDVTDPDDPVILRVELTGRIRGGGG